MFEVLCFVVIISDKKWQRRCEMWGWPSSEGNASVTNVGPRVVNGLPDTSGNVDWQAAAGKLLVRFADDTLPWPWPLYRASQYSTLVQPPFYYTISEEDIKLKSSGLNTSSAWGSLEKIMEVVELSSWYISTEWRYINLKLQFSKKSV